MNSEKLDSYFNEILKELYKSLEAGNGGPFGAAVIVNGELVSVGCNQVISTYDVSKHAEVVALAKATAKIKNFHLEQAILLTTHFPCLMCYHAAKWAKITKVYYLFDYDDTEKLFGFEGDDRFLCDLNISENNLFNDPSLILKKYYSEYIQKKFYEELADIWNKKYREKLQKYDV